VRTETRRTEARKSWRNPEDRMKCTVDEIRESVAEHSWHLAALALLLRPYYPELNFGKVLTMALFHDLGEVVNGDIPHFRKAPLDTWTRREHELNLTHGENEDSRFSLLRELRDAVRAETIKKIAGKCQGR
jgi:5'-deoxynucleotidase YfbR-like HD superfamily hydrolase